MATKAETYAQMAGRATQSLTARIEDWSRFLIMAGRFYKFSFTDIVLIAAQRPDATACASFEQWTRYMGRPIRRGAKGIALLCSRNGRAALRYVFDVTDTVRLEYSLDPNPFAYRQEHEGIISARLEECFHIPADKGLANQLIHLSVQRSEEHWRDFKHDIMRSVHDSFLDGLDEDNIGIRFCSAMTASLAFLLLSRFEFDLDSAFEPDDFAGISDFNAKDIILALGNAVCNSAGIVLRQIEYAIRQYERDVPTGEPAQSPVAEQSQADAAA